MFNNREEVLQFAKNSLNQIRGFVKVFQTKNQKKTKKEKRKKIGKY
jgi:hypothetical protein